MDIITPKQASETTGYCVYSVPEAAEKLGRSESSVRRELRASAASKARQSLRSRRGRTATGAWMSACRFPRSPNPAGRCPAPFDSGRRECPEKPLSTP